jgi:hypothetical protein
MSLLQRKPHRHSASVSISLPVKKRVPMAQKLCRVSFSLPASSSTSSRALTSVRCRREQRSGREAVLCRHSLRLSSQTTPSVMFSPFSNSPSSKQRCLGRTLHRRRSRRNTATLSISPRHQWLRPRLRLPPLLKRQSPRRSL